MIEKNTFSVIILVISIISALLVFHEFASVFGVFGGFVSLFIHSNVNRKTPSELSHYGMIVSKIAIVFCSFVFVTNVLLVDIFVKIIAVIFN